MRKQSAFLVVSFCLVAAASALAGTAKVLINHVGYAPDSARKAVIEGTPGDVFDGFKVIEAETGEVVLTGVPVQAGPVHNWKDWDFWAVNFGGLSQEGTYLIEASSPKGAVRSCPFLVQKDVLERNTLSDVVYYFKGQRSSGLWDKADRRLKFDGKEGEIDARGGWFDATGDYGKHMSHLSFSTYFNPQQVS